jgi:hypothetical protein
MKLVAGPGIEPGTRAYETLEMPFLYPAIDGDYCWRHCTVFKTASRPTGPKPSSCQTETFKLSRKLQLNTPD